MGGSCGRGDVRGDRGDDVVRGVVRVRGEAEQRGDGVTGRIVASLVGSVMCGMTGWLAGVAAGDDAAGVGARDGVVRIGMVSSDAKNPLADVLSMIMVREDDTLPSGVLDVEHWRDIAPPRYVGVIMPDASRPYFPPSSKPTSPWLPHPDVCRANDMALRVRWRDGVDDCD